MKIICEVTSGLIIFGLMTLFPIRACLFRNPRILQYPAHASCNITWYFEQDCSQVSAKLVGQIENCAVGQKCLYTLMSMDGTDGSQLRGTVNHNSVDELSFSFYPSPSTGGCNVIGYSSSGGWYRVLDMGRNYCNLHFLIYGAGLKKDPKFTEITRDEICTQYTGVNCDKYSNNSF